MENEVEKARMILDEDEAKPEEAEEPEGYLDEEEAEKPEGYLDEDEDFQMMSQRISRSGIWI